MFESLGIDLVSLLWQIVAFGGLILLLNLLLFRPLRKTLDARAQRIQESIEEAERVKQQAVQADEEFKKRMEEAQRQGALLIDQGREQGRQEREKLLEEAQAKTQQFLQDARVQLDLERRDAARETRRQVAGLAVLAAGRLVGETLDSEKHRRLVEQYAAELDEPLAELRSALTGVSAGQVSAAQVRSAVPLAEDTQAALRTQLTRAMGREMAVAFAADPRLIGGFVLQVGDQVVDLSVARKLNDLFREMTA
jgi:F-type H+-transporting ATPase subunit b